jgi:integrase
MASIYWRNGVAWGRATVKGVEYRESLGTRSSREAQANFQKWLGSLGAGQSKWADKQTSFRAAVDNFNDNHLPTIKPSSQQRYLVSLIELSRHFERKTLQDISKGDLMAFVNARRKGGVTPSTIRRDLACLSSVFSVAADYELCEDNPVSQFMKTQKRRGWLTEAPPRTRYLSHQEEDGLLAGLRAEASAYQANNQPKRAFTKNMILAAIVVDIDTGLRAEELLRLEWAQVDLEKGEITVLASNAKSGRERAVPLLPRARAMLSTLPRSDKTNLVFWHRTGVGFYDLNHAFQEAAARAGISDVRFHDLRKTTGCRLLQDHRMPIERVSKWLGHATIEQTQKSYAFLDVRHLHDSIAASPMSQIG